MRDRGREAGREGGRAVHAAGGNSRNHGLEVVVTGFETGFIQSAAPSVSG